MCKSLRLFFFLVLIGFVSSCGLLSNNRVYDLPNGYNYVVPESGTHMLFKDNSNGIILGYYLNRVYVDDRYIIGEILEEPSLTEEESKYSFFIMDTKYGKFTENLSKVAFEEELDRLQIRKKVKLVDRDDRLWLRKQKRWF